jgi:hypothetical protein
MAQRWMAYRTHALSSSEESAAAARPEVEDLRSVDAVEKEGAASQRKEVRLFQRLLHCCKRGAVW